MASFTVNPERVDPYKNFKFRVRWDNRTVAGVSNVSELRRTTDVVTYRAGGDPSTSHKSPGRTEFAPVTLSRGVTHDPEFENWALKVWNAAGAPEVSLRDFRKDVRIELMNEAGQVVIAYNLYRCWVSEYVALPDLDASGAETAFERITLQNEGWQRDFAVVEPREPGGGPVAGAPPPAPPSPPSPPPSPPPPSPPPQGPPMPPPQGPPPDFPPIVGIGRPAGGGD